MEKMIKLFPLFHNNFSGAALFSKVALFFIKFCLVFGGVLLFKTILVSHF
jgi:hypothetical protein